MRLLSILFICLFATAQAQTYRELVVSFVEAIPASGILKTAGEEGVMQVKIDYPFVLDEDLKKIREDVFDKDYEDWLDQVIMLFQKQVSKEEMEEFVEVYKNFGMTPKLSKKKANKYFFITEELRLMTISFWQKREGTLVERIEDLLINDYGYMDEKGLFLNPFRDANEAIVRKMARFVEKKDMEGIASLLVRPDTATTDSFVRLVEKFLPRENLKAGESFDLYILPDRSTRSSSNRFECYYYWKRDGKFEVLAEMDVVIDNNIAKDKIGMIILWHPLPDYDKEIIAQELKEPGSIFPTLPPAPAPLLKNHSVKKPSQN